MSTLLFRALLTSLGMRRSFAIYTALDGVLLFAAWFMISERRSPTLRRKIVWFDVGFFTDPVFWSYGLCFFFTVLCVSFTVLVPFFGSLRTASSGSRFFILRFAFCSRVWDVDG